MRQSRFREYCREYSENSSLHGCRYIGEKRTYCERALWLLILCASLSGAFYLIKEIYSKWVENPVIVSLDTKPTPIHNIPFPGVTVCSETKSQQAKYSHSKMINKVLDGGKLTSTELMHAFYMSTLCDINIMDIYNSSELNHITEKEKIEALEIGSYYNEDFFSYIYNVSPDLFITNCKWHKKMVNCKEIFRPIITDEGVCYTFNLLALSDVYKNNVKHPSIAIQKETPKVSLRWNLKYGYEYVTDSDPYPRRALFAGASTGLSFELFTKKEDIDYTCKNGRQGFRISLHSPLQLPTPGLYYFSVPLDSTAFVGHIHPKKITTSGSVDLYDPVSRGCYLRFEKDLEYFTDYSQMHCFMEGYNKYIIHLYGCSVFYSPTLKYICGAAMRFKLGLTEMFSRRKYLAINASEPEDVKTKNVSDPDLSVCLPACTDLDYDMDTSHYDWYWREMSKVYNKMRGNRTRFGDNQVYKSQVLLYFKQPQFVSSIRHELYGFSDFIANFGGLLGLFTGFSILSLMELLYFMTVRVCCNLKLYGSWSGKEI